MLAMSSPEVYQENNLFEGPNGQLLRSLTYSTGAEHLYKVDEVTGKQTPITLESIKVQQELAQTTATKSLVENHTHYTMGGPSVGEYGFMDWDGAINDIFDAHAIHSKAEAERARQTLAEHTYVSENGQTSVDVEAMNKAINDRHNVPARSATGLNKANVLLSSEKQADSENNEGRMVAAASLAAIVPYVAQFTPSSNPASIERVIVDSTSSTANTTSTVSVNISRLPQQIHKTLTVSAQPKDNGLERQDVLDGGSTPDPVLPVALGLAAIWKGGNKRWSRTNEAATSDKPKFFSRENFRNHRYRYSSSKEWINDRRQVKVGAIALLGVLGAGILFGLSSCNENNEQNYPSVMSPWELQDALGGNRIDTNGPNYIELDAKRPVVELQLTALEKVGQEPFNVPEGGAITTELQQLTKEAGTPLCGTDAFRLYLHLASTGKPFFTAGESATYTMSDGFDGITSPGEHRWTEAMIHEIQKWLDDNKESLSN